MEIITILFMSISLSMDTFALSLCYGTIGLSKIKQLILSISVGTFHFFMPLIGIMVGKFSLNLLKIDMKYIVYAIFMLIGIEMLLESFDKNKKIINLNTIGIILFSLSVSIDSFTLGIALNYLSDNYFLCSTLFCITSFLFTLIGLKLGNKIRTYFNNIASIFGGIILIIMAICYLFN